MSLRDGLSVLTKAAVRGRRKPLYPAARTAEVCPCCGKPGFYLISPRYRRCQCCGLYRVVAQWTETPAR